MAQKNQIGENGGERKKNPSANPGLAELFFNFVVFTVVASVVLFVYIAVGFSLFVDGNFYKFPRTVTLQKFSTSIHVPWFGSSLLVCHESSSRSNRGSTQLRYLENETTYIDIFPIFQYVQKEKMRVYTETAVSNKPFNYKNNE